MGGEWWSSWGLRRRAAALRAFARPIGRGPGRFRTAFRPTRRLGVELEDLWPVNNAPSLVCCCSEGGRGVHVLLGLGRDGGRRGRKLGLGKEQVLHWYTLIRPLLRPRFLGSRGREVIIAFPVGPSPAVLALQRGDGEGLYEVPILFRHGVLRRLLLPRQLLLLIFLLLLLLLPALLLLLLPLLLLLSPFRSPSSSASPPPSPPCSPPLRAAGGTSQPLPSPRRASGFFPKASPYASP